MRPLVAVVICAAVAAPVPSKLLREASRRSGLPVRSAVATITVARIKPARSDIPAAYALLGMGAHTLAPPLPRAHYDPATRRLYLRRRPAPTRSAVLNELVRALVDQSYGLRRVVRLRARDRDRWLAAKGIVDGVAAMSAGLRSNVPRGTPLDRFLQLEADVGAGPGRLLAAELRYLGGRKAVGRALRTFPQTTEQLLHVDKFLERERPLPVRLDRHAGGASLLSSQTFGELDVRTLLQAFEVAGATSLAEGWGGGRLALYASGDAQIAALVIRWDTPQDALEWQAAVPRYVTAAFAGASAHLCPPLDACWSGPADIAAGVYEATSVLAAGTNSASVVAATLLRQR